MRINIFFFIVLFLINLNGVAIGSKYFIFEKNGPFCSLKIKKSNIKSPLGRPQTQRRITSHHHQLLALPLGRRTTRVYC